MIRKDQIERAESCDSTIQWGKKHGNLRKTLLSQLFQQLLQLPSNRYIVIIAQRREVSQLEKFNRCGPQNFCSILCKEFYLTSPHLFKKRFHGSVSMKMLHESTGTLLMIGRKENDLSAHGRICKNFSKQNLTKWYLIYLARKASFSHVIG